jgi:hypothetical protein
MPGVERCVEVAPDAASRGGRDLNGHLTRRDATQRRLNELDAAPGFGRGGVECFR